MEKNELKKVLKFARVTILMTIKFEDFDFDNILIDEKSYKDILIYNVSYKTSIGPKPLRNRFDKVDGFISIRVYNGSRYLGLFGVKKYDVIYNRIWYLISLKSGSTFTCSHYYAKIKVDSYDSLPLEKTLTSHNVIILIEFLIKIEITTTTIYFYENVPIN